MQAITPLEYGYTYHIYNRGINSADIFTCNANYKRFLDLYHQHIGTAADTYVWVLMRNHFHLLVRIKDKDNLPCQGHQTYPVRVKDPDRVNVNPSRQFSHLFNAYAQYFNKYTNRHGGLFETPFKRIRVSSDDYFRRLVYYIHHNPVRHGFAENLTDWEWSSYWSITCIEPSDLHSEMVSDYFGGAAEFKAYHQEEDKQDLRDIEKLILE